MKTIVFSYGCPRTATTYMQRMLQRGSGYEYQKIREGDKLHPCQSPDGLIALAQLFRAWQCIFVRTYRDPVEIFESFHAARLPQSTNDGIAANSDERIFRFIEDEQANTRRQIERAKEVPAWRFKLVEVKYSDLGETDARHAFLDELAAYLPNAQENRHRFWVFLNNTWRQKPVREGRLSHGIEHSLISEDLRAEIEDRCG